VDLDPLSETDEAALKTMIERHQALTDSPLAVALLADWETRRKFFVKVMPREYKAALKRLRKEAQDG
jgi:glutamate synthase domain-containing protein 3